MLYPTGPGEPRRIDAGELEAYSDGHWLENGTSIFVCGNAVGKAPRCYVRSLDGHGSIPWDRKVWTRGSSLPTARARSFVASPARPCFAT
jgi:hypothetical protein